MTPPQPDSSRAPTRRAETQLATRTRERYAAIQDLLRRGVSRAGISRQRRLDPHTVRRFADATSIDDLLVNTGPRDSLIDGLRLRPAVSIDSIVS